MKDGNEKTTQLKWTANLRRKIGKSPRKKRKRKLVPEGEKKKTTLKLLPTLGEEER